MRWLIVAALLLFSGFEDRFRYPCQDPANANLPECQLEACKATRTCAEMTTHGPQK